MMERILVVDDEERIRDMIKEYIEAEGYTVDQAANGREALRVFRSGKYDLVILDVMMPQMDGWTVCREIRSISKVPIIMLTARGEEYDKLFAFELGVDDYVVKPFSPRELVARIKAIVRRSSERENTGRSADILLFEGLSINYSARVVEINGQAVDMTPKEFDLLGFFARNPDRVFSREQLLNEVWGYDFFGDDRTVDTHVKMLRESLGVYRRFIVTVWGVGYKFETGGTGKPQKGNRVKGV